MLVKFAKKSLNQQFFLVFVAFVLLILNLVFTKNISIALKSKDSFIAQGISSQISTYEWLNYLVITILLGLVCLISHLLIKRHKLSINTFFPFFVFEILVFVIASYLKVNSVIIIILLLCTFNSLAQMYETKRSMLVSFASTFYISLASILDFNLIWLNIIVFLSLIIYGDYKIRDWIMAVLGMVFVYFWLFLGIFYWDFFSGNSSPSILNELSLTFDYNILLSKLNLSLLIFLAAALFISIRATIYILLKKKALTIETSTKTIVISVFFFLTLLCFLFTKFDCNLLILCCVFASFFISEFLLQYRNKFVPELLCYTLIILAFLVKMNAFYILFSR
jgi:hypothetical protein